ncbi:hypothetical protein C8A00DRAFT_42237 [Chaetomidium leptoderma]|uniref:Uncharacterized protein n=1 Tax=Chaetomidium leptoderma TaxID=669021 RepID=A0AAN6ZZW5_9PEZI|nr:hypothetical protein C8A00DRAFT_42237 [Chaetomidium leptoderma]
MRDPDDATPGSGDDDWEFMGSPTISSLSSFAPEDFSFPLQQSKNPTQQQRTTQPPQISIPIPHLHTPPPTSPRRKPGSLLARTTTTTSSSSSSAGAGVMAGGAAAEEGVTTPTTNNTTNSTTTPTARPGRLHMGIGTGIGVGLGAGLPASPLASAGLRGSFGGAQRFGFGLGFGKRQGQGQGQALPGQSLGGMGGSVTTNLTGEEEEEEVETPSRGQGPGLSLSRAEEGGRGQRWGGDGAAEDRGGEELDYGLDDADDELEGSHTQEYEGFQGYEGSQGSQGSQGHESPHAYEPSSREYDEASSEDEGARHDDASQGYERRHRNEGSREYESEAQKEEDEKEEWSQDREEEPEGETLPPGRVLLMERLCNLVQRLSSVRVGGGMEADVIDVLNAKVDEMEDLLVLAEESAEAEATAEVESLAGAEEQTEAQSEVEAEAQRQEEEEEEAQSGYEGNSKLASGRSSVTPSLPLLRVGDQDIRDLSSPLPWLTSTFKYSELSISPSGSNPELAAATNEALDAAKRAAQAQDEMAERIALESEKLNVELAEVVKKLQARREESDHLHAILIDRGEAAATRILDLEKEIVDLEDDILSNESELRHLRIKIRAVETLCYEFVHPDADPDLFQGIENWKADWVRVRDRMLERKKDRKDRRVRLHRAGCVINSLEQREEESTLTSLGGLSMSVSLLGLAGGRSPKKGYY